MTERYEEGGPPTIGDHRTWDVPLDDFADSVTQKAAAGWAFCSARSRTLTLGGDTFRRVTACFVFIGEGEV